VKRYERLGHVRNRRRSPELNAWVNMIGRCTNPARPDFHSYGGRGIAVCERWKSSFAAFLADMGLRPDGHSLDRIDNAKGYGPDNCRWATKHQQMQNTRATRALTLGGRTQGLNAWAKEIGINKESLRTRLIRGWSIKKALTTGATK
jgi:hypothetical protein